MNGNQHKQDTNQTRKSIKCELDDSSDAVSESCGYVKEEEFHDAPEILNEGLGAFGNPGLSGDGPEDPKREVGEKTSQKKQVVQSRIRRPLIKLARPAESTEEHPEFPNFKTNQDKDKMDTPFDKTDTNYEEVNKIDKNIISKRNIPVSNERRTRRKYNSILSDFQFNPEAWSRGLLCEKTKKISEVTDIKCQNEPDNHRRHKTCYNSLLRNKSNITLELKESSKSSLRNQYITKKVLRKTNEVKSTSSKLRLDEIKSLKQRLAVARSASKEDKSANNATKNSLNTNPYENLICKQPSSNNVAINLPEIEQGETKLNNSQEKEDEKNEVIINSSGEEMKNMVDESNTEMYVSSLRESTDQNLRNSSVAIFTDLAINTDPPEEHKDIIKLKKENEEHKLSQINIKNNNVALLRSVEEQKRKGEALNIEILFLNETLIKRNETIKNLDKKVVEKNSTIAQLRSDITKYKGKADIMEAKDAKIAELQNQISKLNDDYNKLQVDFEKVTNEKQKFIKEIESLKEIVLKLTNEKDNLENKMNQSMLHLENNEANTKTMLDREIQLNVELKESQFLQEEKIADLKDQLRCITEHSSNILGLSEQLMEKDAIICDLEKLRDGVQLLNKDVCCMLSNVFQEFGNPKSENEIESLISSGRILLVKNGLMSLLESNANSKEPDVHEECKKLILNLEDRSAILEAELGKSKKYSESLAGLISSDKIWGLNDGQRNEIKPMVTTRERNVGDTCSMSYDGMVHLPQECKELFVMLEGNRKALMRMERMMKELDATELAPRKGSGTR